MKDYSNHLEIVQHDLRGDDPQRDMAGLLSELVTLKESCSAGWARAKKLEAALSEIVQLEAITAYDQDDQEYIGVDSFAALDADEVKKIAREALG